MNDEAEVESATGKPRFTRASGARGTRPPEVATADIDRLFERIRTMAPPAKADAAWARSFNLTDATIILTWLGISKDGKVDDAALWNSVRMPATRQDALDGLVRQAYAKVFGQIDISEASREDLEGAFVNAYNLGDTRRYVRAFGTLCRHAGIPVPALDARAAADAQDAPARSPEPRAARRPATAPLPKRPPAAKRPDPRGASDSIGEPGIHVNVEIPADWTEDQIRDRLAAVKRALAESDR